MMYTTRQKCFTLIYADGVLHSLIVNVEDKVLLEGYRKLITLYEDELSPKYFKPIKDNLINKDELLG